MGGAGSGNLLAQRGFHRTGTHNLQREFRMREHRVEQRGNALFMRKAAAVEQVIAPLREFSPGRHARQEIGHHIVNHLGARLGKAGHLLHVLLLAETAHKEKSVDILQGRIFLLTLLHLLHHQVAAQPGAPGAAVLQAGTVVTLAALLTDLPAAAAEGIGRADHPVVVHRVDQRHAVALQRAKDGSPHPAPDQVDVGDIGLFRLQQGIQPLSNRFVIEVVAESGERSAAARGKVICLRAGQVLCIGEAEPDNLVARLLQHLAGVEVNRLGASLAVVKIIDQQDFHR